MLGSIPFFSLTLKSFHQNFLNYKSTLEAELGESVFISGLTGPLRIFQRLDGHRHSLDDAAVAWYALQKIPTVDRVLDLGTGIGTVGLVVLWGLKSESLLTCVEAQEISYRLLQANVRCNDLESRVKTLHGDIRDLNLDQKFSLITGSPPYFPRHAGILPNDSQKAHARFELRGDIGHYAQAARRHLNEDGLFIFCFPFQQKQRCIALVQDAGLKIVTIRDIVPRPTKKPLISLYAARLSWDQPIEHEPPFLVLDHNGEPSPEMRCMQQARGFGPDGTNIIA